MVRAAAAAATAGALARAPAIDRIVVNRSRGEVTAVTKEKEEKRDSEFFVCVVCRNARFHSHFFLFFPFFFLQRTKKIETD